MGLEQALVREMREKYAPRATQFLAGLEKRLGRAGFSVEETVSLLRIPADADPELLTRKQKRSFARAEAFGALLEDVSGVRVPVLVSWTTHPRTYSLDIHVALERETGGLAARFAEDLLAPAQQYLDLSPQTHTLHHHAQHFPKEYESPETLSDLQHTVAAALRRAGTPFSRMRIEADIYTAGRSPTRVPERRRDPSEQRLLESALDLRAGLEATLAEYPAELLDALFSRIVHPLPEAARILQVSPATLQRKVDAGHLQVSWWEEDVVPTGELASYMLLTPYGKGRWRDA